MRTTAPIVAVAMLLCLSVNLSAQEPAKQSGLRFVHIGNSHSQTFRLLDPLAKTAGHPQHQDDEISILGAPLWWNWDHPEQNKWKEKLGPDKPWDAILLLCWNTWSGNDRDLKDTALAPLFANEAYKANSKCQVLLYTIWPDANQDMANPPEVRSEAWTEKVADAVVKAHPNSPRPKVIPSSLLIRETGRLADRGEIPGMKTRFEVYTDGGHLATSGGTPCWSWSARCSTTNRRSTTPTRSSGTTPPGNPSPASSPRSSSHPKRPGRCAASCGTFYARIRRRV